MPMLNQYFTGTLDGKYFKGNIRKKNYAKGKITWNIYGRDIFLRTSNQKGRF